MFTDAAFLTPASTAVDAHWGYYDTCASACFEFTDAFCIEGIEIPVTGAAVNTAAGPAKPKATRLKRNNHLIQTEGGLVVGTVLVQVAVMNPVIPNVKSLIGAPVYKRLDLGYIQGKGSRSPDVIWYGEEADGSIISSGPLDHATNFLPRAPLLSDSAVDELVR